MKIGKKEKFKVISLFILTAFIIHSFYSCLPSYAEIPCWNDGTKTYAQGGTYTPLSIVKGGPNPQGSEKVADPVNLATGNFYYEHTDVVVPSRGMPLEFIRFHNSQDDYEGPFGIGWSHSYNIFLIEAADGQRSYVIRRNPDGNKDKFTKNLDGTYTAPAGVFDTLMKDQEGYLITTKSGIRYRFNTTGYLSTVTDRNGNQITLSYDTSTGVLVKITDTIGRDTLLEYNSERKISKLMDCIGRTWNYEYFNSDLISVTTPPAADFIEGATTTYAYDNHNIISITDPKGANYLGLNYDDADRVEELASGFDVTNFTYYENLTTVYDANGVKNDYVLNTDGTTSIRKEYTDAYTYETKYTYDSNKLTTKIIYPKGNATEYAYDGKGNLLTLKQKPFSGSSVADIVTTFTYESCFNFIKTLRDPKGNITTYYYDYEEAALGDLNGDGVTNADSGNLVKIAYPAVGGQAPETKFTYNLYGQLLNVIDPNANVTAYNYDPLTGYLVKTINAQGSLNLTTEFTYDLVGNATSIKDSKTNTTTFEYDSHNNLIKTTSAAPFNYITTYKYDANDNLIQLDKETGDISNPWQTTYYTYDVLDRLQTIKDELQNVTYYTYNPNGNRTSVKDAENNITIYQYDERNLLYKVTDALGNITEYAYDNNGNLKQIKDAKTNITTYTYDDFDRLIKTTYADNSFEEYVYDVNSNLITKKDAKNQTITYAYDNLNRLDLKTYPDTKTVDYAYDKGSRLTDVIDSTGTIHYDYDSANRITKVTYPNSKTISYEYDLNPNRTKLTYPDASFITYEYDQLNRLTAIKDQGGSSIASYQYDALSRRTQSNYANNTQANYQYDDVNRLLSLVNKIKNGTNISSFSYTYDDVGNRKSMTTSDGIHNYTYDKIYQLKTADYSAGSPFSDSTFNYDTVGNRLSTLNGGTTNYTPNNLNQYTQVGVTTYTYDLNGNLTNDGTQTYSYDYENRLIKASSLRGAVGDEAIYTYDPFGRRIKKEVTVNGTLSTVNFIYDGDQIIAEYDGSGNLIKKYIYGPGIDEPIRMEKGGANYYYHYDGLGSITNLTDSSGSILEAYIYDAFGNPNAASTLGNTFMFTGREYNIEAGLYYYRARHYDPTIGRFLQRDPVGYVGGVNLYSYCSNNPLISLDPFGLYTLIIHGRGRHQKGYSGGIGEFLTANGETVKEATWSGYLLDIPSFNQIKNEIKQAAEVAKARGESLNIISHSWGNVLVGHNLNETGIRVNNWVKMGSPYFSTIRPGGTVRVANIIDPRDPVTWFSLPFLSPNVYVENEGESLFEVHNYWDNPKVINTIFKLFKLKKKGKK